MATRKTPAPPVQANLSPEKMRRGIARLERLIGEVKSFDINTVTKRFGPEQQALESTIDGALTSIFGHGTVEYNRYATATKLDAGPMFFSMGGPGPSASEARGYVAEGIKRAIQLLTTAIKWLHDELGDSESLEQGQAQLSEPLPVKSSTKIFVVHGHDDGALNTVARFIDGIGFEAVILSEQPNQGMTIIEKIEAQTEVGFAVVLLTPDDVGGKTPDSLQPRARQNVLLELGYFIGKIGRNKVCALRKGNVDIPTDFAGVVWQPLDDGGAWKQALARELKAAGYAIDWNKVMG